MKLLSTGVLSAGNQFGRVIGAEGVELVLDDGRRVVDASNTAAPLGHRHPVMVEAVRRAAESPILSEGWYWRDRALAAEELFQTAFLREDWVGGVRFCLTGSEANDLALSLAQALTGRAALATRERAYHGGSGLAQDVTVQPHWHGGLSGNGSVLRIPPKAPVHVLPGPLGAQIGAGAGVSGIPENFEKVADQVLAESAAAIVDYTQGGSYYSSDYQDALAAAVRRNGSLWIADEVVTGLGRTGGWFSFHQGRSRPDMVTMGKPLAGGATPGGAVIVSKEIVQHLELQSWRSWSTFRGHPLVVAAIRAVLHVISSEGLAERALELQPVMLAGLSELANAHRSVRRVDGRGLHWTIELHGPDWRDWQGGADEDPIAHRVAARAAEMGAFILTSDEQTSLFLAPPLISEESDLRRIFDALDAGLQVADRELDVAV